MKSPKYLLTALVLLISLASFSQADTTKKDTTTQKTDTTKKKSPNVTDQSSIINTRTQQATLTQAVGTAANTNTNLPTSTTAILSLSENNTPANKNKRS